MREGGPTVMGTKARVFAPMSAISLDKLVPADHFYRRLDRVLDLSFVRDLVRDCYAGCGPALHRSGHLFQNPPITLPLLRG
jgi:hypothetical protein